MEYFNIIGCLLTTGKIREIKFNENTNNYHKSNNY